MTREEMEMFIENFLSLRAESTDAQAWNKPYVFPAWRTDTEYAQGDRVRHGSTLYRCLQSHTSQSTWTPDAAPSLWVRIDDPSIEWPEWKQPQGSTDAYAKGSKVSHNDTHWVSDVDGNVWEPGVAMWTEAE